MDHKDSRVEEQMSLSAGVNGKTWQDNGLCNVHQVQDKQDTGCFPTGPAEETVVSAEMRWVTEGSGCHTH